MAVRVCTVTDPLACVEVDSLVTTVGGGVVNEVVLSGGVVVTGLLVYMVVHEEPNKVFSALLVTSTVKVKGTCTVAVTAFKRNVRTSWCLCDKNVHAWYSAR